MPVAEQGGWPRLRAGSVWAWLGLWLALWWTASASAQPRLLPVPEVRSGLAFAGRDVQGMQADVAANPAQLWLAQGRARWTADVGLPGRRCVDCHGDLSAQRGVAPGFPRVHAGTGRLFNLEDQIRHCVAERQRRTPPAFESDELLALTSAVVEPSAGLPLQAPDDAGLLTHRQAGAALFVRRQGQLNLACTQCHDQRWGQRFHTDPLSQGQPNAYPVYRLEWQTLGSLERRLRSCYAGIRAEPPPYGDLALRQLAVYLNWRAAGLPIEMPAVRK